MAASVIGALRVKLGLDNARFMQGLRQSQSSVQRFGRSLAVIGAGITAAGAGIMLAVRRQLNAADDMGKLAQKIGVPVDELSRLTHAADMSGVAVSSLQTGVSRLSRAMVDTPDKFRRIGVAVRDADGRMRKASDVLSDVAQVLSTMPDGAQKTALAMDLLGRSGADLIPMLNGGSEALRGMMAEADALGIVITPEMFRNAEIFNDNISRLTKQFTGLWRMIAANLAPVLVSLSNTVVSVAAAFRNLSPGVQSLISILAGAILVIGPVASGLGLMIMTAGPFFAAMMSMASGVGALVASLVTLRGALLASGIGAAVVAAGYLLAKFLELVQATGSFGDALTAMGELAGLVWEGITGSAAAIPPALKGIWALVRSEFSRLVADLSYAWASFLTVFKTGLAGIGATDLADKLASGPIHGANRAGNDAMVASSRQRAEAAAYAAEAAGLAKDAFGPARDKLAELTAKTEEAATALDGSGGGGLAGAAESAGGATEKAGGAAKDASEKMSKLQQVVKSLREEAALLKASMWMSPVDAAVIANLQGAGVSADSPDGREIERLTHTIEGMKQLKSATEDWKTSLSNGFKELTRRASSFGDVLSNLLDKFADMLWSQGFDMIWNGGGLSKKVGGALSWLGIGANANGTDNWRGGLTKLHERGDEIYNLPGGTQVIPHDISKRMADKAAGLTRVEVVLSPDLEARILEEAHKDSVQVTHKTMGQVSQRQADQRYLSGG